VVRRRDSNSIAGVDAKVDAGNGVELKSNNNNTTIIVILTVTMIVRHFVSISSE
jgi:hypothetical protein